MIFPILEAGEEVIQLKEQLHTLQMQVEQSCEGKGNSDASRAQKELQLESEVCTMREMLGTLTEQKLHFTMEVSDVNIMLKHNLYDEGSKDV